MTRPHLLDVPPSRLASLVEGELSPPYRIRQLAEWIHHGQPASFDDMSNLPVPTRRALGEKFRIDLPRIVGSTPSTDDGSEKFLFELEDGARIEAVNMPSRGRTTICVSSQAGCAVGCTFCVTGFFGGGRDLAPSEIVGQVRALQRLKATPADRTNVVFMGMGEPLLNLDSLRTAIEILEQSIAPKRITVSTAGITPAIDELARLERRPNLAVSINAPDQERRERIMPITRKYPLADLVGALARFPTERGREITIEYVLLSEFNDTPSDAAALAALLHGVRAKVNAIPFNPDPSLPPWMKRPDDERIERFAAALARRGVPVTIRRSKGLENAAACGQLRGKTDRPRRPRSD